MALKRKLLWLSAAAVCLGAFPAVAQDSPIDRLTPVTDEMLVNPADGDWLMWRRTYNGWGYSPLDQINKENVGSLELAWSWAMTPGSTQETPLAHDGIIFVTTSNQKTQALDGATGDLIWEYQHELPEGFTNPRGMRSKAIYGNNLILATSDAHLIALDSKTGDLVWDVQVADWNKGWRYTSGPIVADGVIVQGMTGCGAGQPGGCFITGHNAENGEEIWRIYTIARPGTPEDSWNGLPLESRYGGSAWISGSYDPEQGLTFIGVGQPYPWVAEMSGLSPASSDPNVSNDALYTNSTLAIDVKTGELKWYYQHLPNDSLDLDYVYERMMIDLPGEGGEEKLVVTTGKVGIVEALDRTTGGWAWASEATVPQNVIQSIDPETGAKTINPDAIPRIGQTTVNCPADPGGRAWPATAYSPRTQALYMPLAEFCSDTTPNPVDPGQIYTGGGRATFARKPVPDSDGNIGRVDAIKLTDRSQMWSHRQRSPMASAVLPTGGGLVFAGDLNRYFSAFDDETGEILWQTRAPNSLNSFPISYESNGKQYVAVVANNGSSQLRSWGSLTPEILSPSDNGTTLMVYALPD
jgi:alcohol dehydrogenase (cytochrome c)